MNALLTFGLGLPPAVCVHEAGHALAAWLLGRSPRVVSVGRGSIISLRRIGATTIVLRAVPLSGHVLTLPMTTPRRWVLALFILAGPGANLATMVCLGILSYLWPTASHAFGAVAAAQGWLLVRSMLPWRRKRSVAGGTDGYNLIRALFAERASPGPDAVAAFIETKTPGETNLAVAAELTYQISRQDVGKERWAREDQFQAFRRLADRYDIADVTRCRVLDLLVSTALTRRDTGASADELDAWSMQAMSLSSEASIKVSRGGVLVGLGRPAEAEAMLITLLDEPMDMASMIACRAFLVQAATLRQDHATARIWKEQAFAAVPADQAHHLRLVEALISQC